MKTLIPLSLVPVTLLTAGLSAQHSLLISPDESFVLRGFTATSAMAFVDDQESILVTPDANTSYDARPFGTYSTINVMHGDGDNDGNLNAIDPYGDLNCLFVRHRPPHAETGPVDPGTVFMSVTSDGRAAVATTAGIQTIQDGDLFRCRNGRLEVFVHEADLTIAMGGSGTDIDLDGMAQDAAGNLWLSLWNLTTQVGSNTYLDGDVVYIPATAITYDANGMVTAIQANAAQIWATEADMDQLVVNSGTLDQAGAPCTRAGDVAGLSIDPNGGTWASPQLGTVGPNLVFGSNIAGNFDNLWSTANGGSAAVINGVTMGYLNGPADGTKIGIGLLASGQDGINAMTIVPAQTSWISMDSPRSGTSTQGVFTIEIGRCQPNAPLGILMSLWPRDGAGGWVDSTPLNPAFGLFQGNPGIEVSNPFLTVALAADAAGYLTLNLNDPGGLPPGLEVLIQGVSIPYGRPFTAYAATGTASFTF